MPNKDEQLFNHIVGLSHQLNGLKNIVQNGAEHITEEDVKEWKFNHQELLRKLEELPCQIDHMLLYAQQKKNEGFKAPSLREMIEELERGI